MTDKKVKRDKSLGFDPLARMDEGEKKNPKSKVAAKKKPAKKSAPAPKPYVSEQIGRASCRERV